MPRRSDRAPAEKPHILSALRTVSQGGTGSLVAAFFVGWVFMYTDRAVFSPVLGVIGSEFDVTAAKLGLLASTFYLSYAAFQIPVGFVAERVGRKKLLVWGFTLFGASTFFSGLAPSFTALMLLGFITGIGQATYYPIQYSLAAEMVPPHRRTLAFAVINSGMAVGIAGGTLAAAYVAFGLGLGWRLSLMVMGGLTVAIAFTLGKVVPSSTSRRSPTPAKESFRNVLRKDQVAAYLAGFCSLYGFFALLTWLPYYFETSRGFDRLSAGAVSTVAAWSSIPAGIAAAYISDSARTHRRIVLVMFPIAALALVLLPFVGTALAIGLLVVYGAFGKLASDPLLIAYLAERTPASSYTLTYGMFNFAGMLGSVLAPVATGTIVDQTGEMTSAFLVAAGFLTCGWVALWVLGSEHAHGGSLVSTPSQVSGTQV